MALKHKTHDVERAAVAQRTSKPAVRTENEYEQVSPPSSALGRIVTKTPAALRPADILTLQRTVGNQVVRRILNNSLSSPSSTSAHAIQRLTEEEEEPLQGKFEAVHRKENRTGLPDDLKAGIENLSGLLMDDVKVHFNSSKPATVQALAYTQGTEIHVAPGQEQHLPHEAWHLVQQKQGRVGPTTHRKGLAINDDSRLEQEADAIGEQAHQRGIKILQSRQASAPDSDEEQNEPRQLSPDSAVTTQLRWMETGSRDLYWDTLIDGLQWYFNTQTNSFHYVIADREAVRSSQMDFIEEHAGETLKERELDQLGFKEIEFEEGEDEVVSQKPLITEGYSKNYIKVYFDDPKSEEDIELRFGLNEYPQVPITIRDLKKFVSVYLEKSNFELPKPESWQIKVYDHNHQATLLHNGAHILSGMELDVKNVTIDPESVAEEEAAAESRYRDLQAEPDFELTKVHINPKDVEDALSVAAKANWDKLGKADTFNIKARATKTFEALSARFKEVEPTPDLLQKIKQTTKHLSKPQLSGNDPKEISEALSEVEHVVNLVLTGKLKSSIVLGAKGPVWSPGQKGEIEPEERHGKLPPLDVIRLEVDAYYQTADGVLHLDEVKDTPRALAQKAKQGDQIKRQVKWLKIPVFDNNQRVKKQVGYFVPMTGPYFDTLLDPAVIGNFKLIEESQERELKFINIAGCSSQLRTLKTL